jgi:hypothetical protein
MGTAQSRCVKCTDIPMELASEPRTKACERVAAAQPGCRCEIESVQPDLSPGPVGLGETLARFVADHDFDRETMEVKSSLFSHVAVAGMSTTRIERAGNEALAQQQRSKSYLGYVLGSCKAIRSLDWEGERLFAIYDTAISENRAHADVCQAVFRPRSRASEMRRKLQLVFTRSLTQASG